MAVSSDLVAASSSTSQASAAPMFAAGTCTIDASITAADDLVVECGFTPRYIKWDNTTGICGEWFHGMAADSAVKTIANGTRTLEVTGGNHGFTVCDSDGTANTSGRCFKVAQNATLALITADDVIRWIAIG